MAADITAGSVRAEALGERVAGVTTSGTWREHPILTILRVGLGGTVSDTTSGTWREHHFLRVGLGGTVSDFVGCAVGDRQGVGDRLGARPRGVENTLVPGESSCFCSGGVRPLDD